MPPKVSAPRDGLAAGADLELRLDQAAVSAAIELRGGNAWQTGQPLRLLAFPAARNLLPIALELRDCFARLPAVEVVMFAVLDSQGRPLWTGAGTKDRGLWLELPPPFELAFRVVDEKGAPVQGAHVLHALPTLAAAAQGPAVGPRASVLRELGTTDADGRLTAVVPASGNPWQADPGKGASAHTNLTFVATAPGRGTAVTALGVNLCLCNGVCGEPPVDRVLPLTLRPQMRLCLSPPVPGADATLATTLYFPSQFGSGQWPWTLRCSTDAAGWFDLPLPDETATGLLEMEGVRLPDGTNLPRCVLEIPAGVPEQRCDLAKLRRLSVQVLGADAGPARGVPVTLRSHSQRCPEVTPAYTNQAGRVQFRVGRGDWLVFITDGERAVWRSLRDTDAGADWQLTLQSLPTMICRIVDADGKPVAGASLRMIANKPARAAPATGEDRCLHSLAQDLMFRQRWTSRSDADGLLRVPVLGDDFTWQLSFGFAKRVSGLFTWRAGEQPVSVPIE